MARRSPRPCRRDDGFTLIEILVVIVILPLAVGAVADLFITALQGSATVTGTQSDTQAALILSSYYGRDVESATEVTTDPAWACGWGQTTPLPGGDTLQGAKPELSLFLADSASPSGTEVTYWVSPSGEPDGQGAIIRTSCTNFSSTNFSIGAVPPAASTADSAVAASLGAASAATLQVSVADSGNGSGAYASGWEPTTLVQSITLSAGHGAEAVQQSGGFSTDLVASPRP